MNKTVLKFFLIIFCVGLDLYGVKEKLRPIFPKLPKRHYSKLIRRFVPKKPPTKLPEKNRNPRLITVFVPTSNIMKESIIYYKEIENMKVRRGNAMKERLQESEKFVEAVLNKDGLNDML